MLEYLEFFGDIVTSIPDDEATESSASIGKTYPNPFTDQTTVTFSLREKMHVGIDIFSLDGRKIATLIEQDLGAGEHSVIWDGTDSQGNEVNSGIYLCTLRTNSVIATKKLIRY